MTRKKRSLELELEQTYDTRDVKIVVGDMNAQIGSKELYKPVIGRNSLHTVSNDNGQRYVNFAAPRGMAVRSTFYPRKDIHKATWRSPDHQTEKRIDHF